jgi:hypothetical protein
MTREKAREFALLIGWLDCDKAVPSLTTAMTADALKSKERRGASTRRGPRAALEPGESPRRPVEVAVFVEC